MRERIKEGFTLIEMMVVVAIIGVLGAMLLPNVSRMLAKAKVSGTQGIVNSAFTSLMAYADDRGDYPICCWGDAHSLRDYLREYASFQHWDTFLRDSWNRWLRYHPPTCWGIVGAIYSRGANGSDQTWSCWWWRYRGFAGDDIGRAIRR